MDEAMKDLRQGYVIEFYIRQIEDQIGYHSVKPQRHNLEELARDILEGWDDTATLGELLSFFHSPYMVMSGAFFCIILNIAEQFSAEKKEEKING